jgi:ankyrin repeat protein
MNSFNKTAYFIVLALSLCSGTVFSMDIFEAAREGDLARVQELIGVDPSVVRQQDLHGWTPLHWAAFNGCTRVVQVFLCTEAGVNLQNNFGSTPLHLAAYCARVDVVRVLLAAGADPSIVNRDGLNPLWLAITQGHEETANIISDAMEIRRRAVARVLASATHPRLGADSPVALLPQHLMADTARSAV